MRKHITYCFLMVILLYAMLFSGCQQQIKYPPMGPGYWNLSSAYKTDYLQVPYIWFYSEAIDKNFENTSAFGELLTDDGWIDITVSWDENAYMTITDTNSNVLLCGSITKGGYGSKNITFSIDDDNIYNGQREMIHFSFSESKDARVDKIPTTDTQEASSS